MSKPLIDEIVCKIVDSLTDKLCWGYYNTVIRKDPDFDVTAYVITGPPEEVTREMIFHYIYNKVWNSASDSMSTDEEYEEYEEYERIFLT